MGLYDVFLFVKQDFPCHACPAFVGFGKEHLAENSDPTEGSNAIGGRVVFVPSTDPAYAAPLAVQGAGLPPPAMSAGQNPRSFLRRQAGCELHLWAAAQLQEDGTQQLAADFFALDALINQTALSLYKAQGLGGQLVIAGGKNLPNPAHMRRGLVYQMSIRVDVPLVDIDFPCARISTESFTWLTQDDVTVQATVDMRESLPTGPFMSTVAFATTAES